MAKAKTDYTNSTANNPYSNGIIQNASQDAAPAEKVDGRKARKKDPSQFYRFNAKLPIECKAYLQEMAWRNRTDMNAYLSSIVLEDMKRHPEWTEIDRL